MSKEEILDILRKYKQQMATQYGVETIGLFGSYAKGAANNNSDIDILVKLKEPKYEWLAGLQIFLSQQFNKRVDIVREGKHLSERFIVKVKKDLIYA
jgi:predicted nucleotidyltransferase